MADTDYEDDLALLMNTFAWAQSLHHHQQHVARSISHYVNADTTGFMCFKQEGAISTWSGKSFKLIDQLTYMSSKFLSTESDINILIGKAWKLLIIWKSDLS